MLDTTKKTTVQCCYCLDLIDLRKTKQAVISFEQMWLNVWFCADCHTKFIAKGGNRFVCITKYFTRN